MSESTDAPRSSATRKAMLEQLAHLRDEVGALERHMALIPDDVLVGRPLPTDPSFKEIYGLLADFDERVFLPVATQFADADDVRLDLPDDHRMLADGEWNEVEMPVIIQQIQAARSRLVRALSDLPLEAWHRRVALDGERTDVFGLAYAIIEHDAELLRAAALRLHESRLTSREEDLPK